MIHEYIEMALKKAHYEVIDDEDPFYGEVRVLQGVWASGRTMEECRNKLAEVIDGWISLSLSRGFPIPEIEGISVKPKTPRIPRI